MPARSLAARARLALITLLSYLRDGARRARASPWSSPLARVLLGGAALVLLAVLGGSALAGAERPPGSVPALQDAAPVVLAETVISLPPKEPGDGGASPAPPSPAPPQGSARAPGASSKATPEDPVSLNEATLEDLRRLPGVGPKKAEAILALRARMGRFARPEDLLKVKGIGRGTFRKLRPLVRVEIRAPSDAGHPR